MTVHRLPRPTKRITDEQWRANVLAFFDAARRSWRMDPVTDRQRFYFESLGRPVPATKGAAWDEINADRSQ